MFKQVMMYGATAWANCSVENLKKVLQLQKRAARIILDANIRTNSVLLFKQLNWLAFHDKVKSNKCVLAYKQFHGNCLLYIKEMLTSNADIYKPAHQDATVKETWYVHAIIKSLRGESLFRYPSVNSGTLYLHI